MSIKSVVVAVCTTGTFFGAPVTSFGQPYPVKPVRMVTAEAGASTDLTARLIAQRLASSFAQPVIVDNRGGGGGVIAGDMVAKAPPDGYTLLFSASALWIGPLLQDKTPYDPLRDFAPIALASKSPMVLVVHPGVLASSVGELIALARSKPGMLNYGSGNTGSSTHLSAELFKAMTNINIVRVPYKGGGPAVLALLSAQLQMMFITPASVESHIKSGRLRALAVTSANSSELLPGLPTVAASGLPGYEWVSTLGMFGPAAMPASVVNRLNKELVQILNERDMKEKFLVMGQEAIASSPGELLSMMKSESARLAKIIRDTGIKAD